MKQVEGNDKPVQGESTKLYLDSQCESNINCKQYTGSQSCILWGASTEVSTDVSIDISVEYIGRYIFRCSTEYRLILGRVSLDISVAIWSRIDR